MSKLKVSNLDELADSILMNKRKAISPAYIVGISGIDGSGKGFISNKLKLNLEKKGFSVHLENLDGWLNLPEKRFSDSTPAETFYKDGFRFDELVHKILIPYEKNNRINTKSKYIEETWNSYEIRDIVVEPVDVLILEGVFIFNKMILPYLDYKVWIDCTFETALERAITRNQEGLGTREIIDSYHNRFFPAQKIHFDKDNPSDKADLLFINDAKLLND